MRPLTVAVLRQLSSKRSPTVGHCSGFFTANIICTKRLNNNFGIEFQPEIPRETIKQIFQDNKSKAKEAPLQFSPAAYTFWMTGSHYAWNSDPAQGDEGIWKTVNDGDIRFK